MKPDEKMHAAVEEVDLEPCDLYTELGTLIVEGRLPGLTDKGFGEGPHCSTGHNRHQCEPTASPECQKYDQILKHMLLLWKNGIPMTIEVLLYPGCCSPLPNVDSVHDMPYILLEQWTIHMLPRRVPDASITPRGLIQAVRSFLYFSQLCAWYSLTGGKSPQNVHYRVCVPGEAFSSKFTSQPDCHIFPVANIGRNSAMKVLMKCHPRCGEIPTVPCQKHDLPLKTLKGAADEPLNSSEFVYDGILPRSSNSPADSMLGESLLDPPNSLCMYPKRYQSPSRCGSPSIEVPEHLMFGKKTPEAQSPPRRSRPQRRPVVERFLKKNLGETPEPKYEKHLPAKDKPILSYCCIEDCMKHVPKDEMDKVLQRLRERHLRKRFDSGQKVDLGEENLAGYLEKMTLDGKKKGTTSFQKVCDKRTKAVSPGEKLKGKVLGKLLPDKFSLQSRSGSERKDSGLLFGSECKDSGLFSKDSKLFSKDSGLFSKDSGLFSKDSGLFSSAQKAFKSDKKDSGLLFKGDQTDSGLFGSDPKSFRLFSGDPKDRLLFSSERNDSGLFSSDQNDSGLFSERKDSGLLYSKHGSENDQNSDMLEKCAIGNGPKPQRSKTYQQLGIRPAAHPKYCAVNIKKCGAFLTKRDEMTDEREIESSEKENETLMPDELYEDGVNFNAIPSAEKKAIFRRSLDSATSLVFHQRSGLPLTSSPAPIRKCGTCFDYDSTLTSVSAIKRALFEKDNEQEVEEQDISPLSTSAPASIFSSSLLGTFEESVLNGRLEPVSTVEGFTAEIGASGSFCPRHIKLPVTVFFYTLQDMDKVTSPYMGHIDLRSKDYHIPKKGTVQVTLFNPHSTVVKMFVVRYDLSDMPVNCQTFLRQRTLYMPQEAKEQDTDAQKWLRYLIHLRFVSSKSGRIYLHTDIRVIIFRKSDLDAATVHGQRLYELRTFTHSPLNPKFSPHKP